MDGQSTPGPTFVLVGGMMHAAKHMDRLPPLLHPYQSIAVELPGLGADVSNPLEASLESHVAAVLAAVDSAPTDVVLMGHSLAGVLISAVAEQRPGKIQMLVFLAAETRPGEQLPNPNPSPKLSPKPR